MNKIFKYLLIGIGVGSIFFASCKADLITKIPRTSYSISANSNHTFTSTDITCYMHNLSNSNTTSYDIGTGKVVMTQATLYCFTGNVIIYNDRTSSTSIYYYSGINNYFSGYFSGQCPSCPTIDQNYCTENNLCPSCPSCETCDDPYTSLECQTEYNLIPISSVTSAYCETNFNLIDPATCPISEGTGAINWSSLFINNTQYAGNDEIQILLPEYLAWNIVFNTGVTYVEVEGYNADTDYIENVIAKTQMTPTNEDVSKLVNGLQVYIPYIFISMIIIFALILINKLFR